jgi:nitric oxide reductase subunit B
LSAIIDKGLAFARSQAFIDGTTFQTFTWLRILGGVIFLFGGLIPLVWFITSRAGALRNKETFKPILSRHEPAVVSELMDTN